VVEASFEGMVISEIYGDMKWDVQVSRVRSEWLELKARVPTLPEAAGVEI
jgi:hypothetical protein